MVELLTIEEVAERLRVSVLTVRWLRRTAVSRLRSRSVVACCGIPAMWLHG